MMMLSELNCGIKLIYFMNSLTFNVKPNICFHVHVQKLHYKMIGPLKGGMDTSPIFTCGTTGVRERTAGCFLTLSLFLATSLGLPVLLLKHTNCALLGFTGQCHCLRRSGPTAERKSQKLTCHEDRGGNAHVFQEMGNNLQLYTRKEELQGRCPVSGSTN